MEQHPPGPPMRARQSRYRRRAPSPPRSILALVLVLVLGLSGLAGWRVLDLIRATTGSGNPLSELAKASGLQPGTIPYKLQHGQRVNLLLLGYGGSENDAPWLTDSIMVLSIDPAQRRAFEISVPRDLMVPINAWASGKPMVNKVNVAYEVGMDDTNWPGKLPQFQVASSRDAGGRLSMQTVGAITGIHFDGFVGVDFKAFRDLVNALGGVQVCLAGPLDDNQYPNYVDGYVPGGIHFKAGCQQVNGEQALELARSRHAVQAAQASDFARAARQRQLLDAMRLKATSLGVITRAPALMDALQKNFITDLGLGDLDALYRFSSHLPASAISSAALTDSNLVAQFYQQPGSCGPWNEYVLCPVDPTFHTIQGYFASVFIDPAVLAEAAPVELVNASFSLADMGSRVAQTLAPLGFRIGTPLRSSPATGSVVYDYSGGRYPLTAKWLAQYFGADLVTATATTPPPTPGASTSGLVVVMGRNFALRWIGQ